MQLNLKLTNDRFLFVDVKRLASELPNLVFNSPVEYPLVICKT